MRYVAAILFCAATAIAQQVTSPDKLPKEVSGFDQSQASAPLPCTVHPMKPTLNFGFRFQAGYTVETSFNPYLGGRHHWYIVFRVTPVDTSEDPVGPPVYFLDSIDVPEPRQTGFTAGNTGEFQLGEGRYDVKWSLFDDLGRVCRHEWTIDAHLTAGERSAKVAMPPGTAGDFSWPPTTTAHAMEKSRHVTILLNAAMPVPVVTADWEAVDPWGMLMSILASLVEQMPEASVRVVAFETAQQQELFRKDDFALADMNDVAHVSNATQRWAVDYHALQNPSGAWDLLRNLENKEIDAPSPADTVIFLSAPEGRFEKMPPGMPGPQTRPRFFYLRWEPEPRIARATGQRAPSGIPMNADSPKVVARQAPHGEYRQGFIEQSIRQLNGKIFLIRSPADLNKAIATIGR